MSPSPRQDEPDEQFQMTKRCTVRNGTRRFSSNSRQPVPTYPTVPAARTVDRCSFEGQRPQPEPQRPAGGAGGAWEAWAVVQAMSWRLPGFGALRVCNETNPSPNLHSLFHRLWKPSLFVSGLSAKLFERGKRGGPRATSPGTWNSQGSG